MISALISLIDTHRWRRMFVKLFVTVENKSLWIQLQSGVAPWSDCKPSQLPLRVTGLDVCSTVYEESSRSNSASRLFLISWAFAHSPASGNTCSWPASLSILSVGPCSPPTPKLCANIRLFPPSGCSSKWFLTFLAPSHSKEWRPGKGPFRRIVRNLLAR